MSKNLTLSKYLTELPSEDELRRELARERNLIEQRLGADDEEH